MKFNKNLSLAVLALACISSLSYGFGYNNQKSNDNQSGYQVQGGAQYNKPRTAPLEKWPNITNDLDDNNYTEAEWGTEADGDNVTATIEGSDMKAYGR